MKTSKEWAEQEWVKNGYYFGDPVVWKQLETFIQRVQNDALRHASHIALLAECDRTDADGTSMECCLCPDQIKKKIQERIQSP